MSTNAKEKILEAADELFGEIGFDATTTREIAERANVNKALIHYHFQSKQGLLTELLDRYYVKLGQQLQSTLSQDVTLRERLQTLIDAYVDFLIENRNFGRIVQREAAGGAHLDRIATHMTPLFDLGIRALKDVYPKTKKGETAAEHLLVSYYGAIISYFTYDELLSRLLNKDPMSKALVKERKLHLSWLANVLIDSVENGPPEK